MESFIKLFIKIVESPWQFLIVCLGIFVFVFACHMIIKNFIDFFKGIIKIIIKEINVLFTNGKNNAYKFNALFVAFWMIITLFILLFDYFPPVLDHFFELHKKESDIDYCLVCSLLALFLSGIFSFYWISQTLEQNKKYKKLPTPRNNHDA